MGRSPECELCLPDPEVSSRHATLTWCDLRQGWLLADVGSLNGSVLNGTVISTAHRQPGPAHLLSHRDVIEFGTASKVAVASSEALPGEGQAAAAPGTPPMEAGRCSGSASSSSSAGKPVISTMAFECAPLGIQGAVQQCVGVTHLRKNMPCEDLSDWRAPFGQRRQSALFCLYDGHSGCMAAQQASKLLPSQLEQHWQPYRAGGASCNGPQGSPHKRQKLEIASCRGFDDDAHASAALAREASSTERGPVCEATNGSGLAAAAAVGQLNSSALQQLVAPLLPRQQPLSEDTASWQCQALVDAFLQTDAHLDTDDGCTATAVVVDYHLDHSETNGAGALPDLARGGGDSSAGPGPSCSNGGNAAHGGATVAEGAGACTPGCSSSTPGPPGAGAAGRPSGFTCRAANVGDSHALLLDLTNHTWHLLTEDHRIGDNPKEQQRILQQSGQAPRSRLYGLNIARMLGDKFLKTEDVGFTATPYVSMPIHIPAGHAALLVIASDGLWDVATFDRAVAIVSKAVADDAAASPAAIADVLVSHAMRNRSRDDITVVAVKLQ